MSDPARSASFGLDWLAPGGDDADVVLSTRVVRVTCGWR